MNVKKVIPVLVVAAVLGCQRKETKAPVSEMQPNETKAPVSQASTASEAAAAASSQGGLTPARSHAGGQEAGEVGHGAAPAAPNAPVLKGEVAETMNSGGYTYMKLKTTQGDAWTAVRETSVKKGQSVTVAGNMVMKDFESTTLNRKFDTIVFGMLEGEAAGVAPASSSKAPGAEQQAARDAMMAQHAAAAKGPADVGDVKVPKAEGADARTVAEVFAKKAELKDKSVTVRGKVVKSLSGIMGKNWLHLRDGSGSADKKDNDLTVTTSETAAVGDVVVVKGTVHVDRDFGAGYAYPVIVEEASVKK
jgi:hypothetical protein